MKTKYIALATALSLCVFSGQVLAKKRMATASTTAYASEGQGFAAFNTEDEARTYVDNIACSGCVPEEKSVWLVTDPKGETTERSGHMY